MEGPRPPRGPVAGRVGATDGPVMGEARDLAGQAAAIAAAATADVGGSLGTNSPRRG